MKPGSLLSCKEGEGMMRAISWGGEAWTGCKDQTLTMRITKRWPLSLWWLSRLDCPKQPGQSSALTLPGAEAWGLPEVPCSTNDSVILMPMGGN